MDTRRFLLALPGKIGAQGRLILRDPRRFIENLDHTLHPGKLQQKWAGLEPMPPMHVSIDAGAATKPYLNVLLPRLGPGSLTGGPNTAISIACGLAARGIPIRILAVDEGVPADTGALWNHVLSIAGTGQARPDITFGSTVDPANPARLGPLDVFLATYWTTAFRLKPVLPRMASKDFIYLIQDFEPGFYAWSTPYAQALETYGMRFRALINERLLADYLVETRTGRFADPGFMARCAVFEPAVDRRLFHPVEATGARRQLLFYARRQTRNLFGIGLEALGAAVRDPLFADGDWKFVAIGGGLLARTALGGGRFLEPAPWLNYEDYARLIRESDILLCPMLSPHTSYPVLEKAACRGVVVTNTFADKTQDRLRAISANIIAEAPSVEALCGGIVSAARRLASGSTAAGSIALPPDWPTALHDTVVAARDMFHEAVRAADAAD
jgi:glycosyltransferase involved in cell wall biosynthesis